MFAQPLAKVEDTMIGINRRSDILAVDDDSLEHPYFIRVKHLVTPGNGRANKYQTSGPFVTTRRFNRKQIIGLFESVPQHVPTFVSKDFPDGIYLPMSRWAIKAILHPKSILPQNLRVSVRGRT